jgi:hypothetical protein
MRKSLLVAVILTVGCNATRRDNTYCDTTHVCPGEQTCDQATGLCVPSLDAGPPDELTPSDGPTSFDGPASHDEPIASDGPTSADTPTLSDGMRASDGPISPSDSAGPVDSAGDVAIADTRVDLSGPEVAADTRVPDAAGTCWVNSDCFDPAKGFCVAGACTGCTVGLCSSSAVCATSGPSAGRCVECLGDGECTKNPAKGFCVNNACTGCTATLCGGAVDGGISSVCATSGAAIGQCVECVDNSELHAESSQGLLREQCLHRLPESAGSTACTGTKPVCATTGASAGRCVECIDNAGCGANPAKGFCVNNACTGCTAALCSGGTASVCATSGASSGQCVECVDNTTCTKDAAKGFCVSNACTGCQNAGASACSGAKPLCATSGAACRRMRRVHRQRRLHRSAAKGFCVSNACTGCTAALCANRTDGKTACATTGTFAGQCEICTSNAQCAGTTPICASATDTCRACASDSECSAVGPGVCMTDGHCATDGEAIYVGPVELVLGKQRWNGTSAGVQPG